jgi:hypothetical protein
MSMVNCVSTICHYLPTSVLHSNLIPKIFFYISNVLDYNLLMISTLGFIYLIVNLIELI